MKTKRSIKKNKDGKFDVFIAAFCPMYCGTFDTKEEAKKHIKGQKGFMNNKILSHSKHLTKYE